MFLNRRGFLLILALLVLPVPVANAYHHHTSRVRFKEHSNAVFDQAKQAGKPIFMLISAVWCYWCKYFEQHALETEEVSSYLNRHYLNIFVDHDRRMDLTRKYVRGLPMVVLFDPDGRVRQSFAGALKKEDFLSILMRIEGEVRSDLAKGTPRAPRAVAIVAPDPVPVTPETYQQFLQELVSFLDEHLDTVHGGFGKGDKHPNALLLAYLLERHDLTRDRRYLAAVEKSLDGILRGIYDPMEGGFFRYAEGREWRQPHFEKMAYLNASLAVVFDRAHRVTQNPRYGEAADNTIAYLLRTLYDAKAGGFYGSQTADPAYYRLSQEERRAARRPPVNRDKVTAWNAEAALAFLALSQATGRPDFRDVALRSLEFMRRHLLTDKGVYHIYDHKTGRGHLRGQLEANAWAALAFLEGHRVSGKAVYKQAAEQLLGYALAELFDPSRGAFVEERNPDERDAPRSSRFPLDTNGIMAEVLLRAHRLTGRAEYLEAAKRVLAALGAEARSVLVEDSDTAPPARVSDAVFYLMAYGQVVGARR